MVLRGGEHLNDYRNINTKSPLFEHASVHHQGRLDVQFNMKSRFRDPLTRQINEVVRISKSTAEVQINFKSEWHGPLVQPQCV